MLTNLLFLFCKYCLSKEPSSFVYIDFDNTFDHGIHRACTFPTKLLFLQFRSEQNTTQKIHIAFKKLLRNVVSPIKAFKNQLKGKKEKL